jgi:hypothetical protein
MMNCQTCLDRMGELADAKLDPGSAEAMRAHIAGCAACRREFESLSRTLSALDGLPAGAPSHRLRARVMGDIETEKLTLRRHADWASSIRSAAGSPRRRRFSWGPALLQALGACALAVLGFSVGERTATQRQLADLRARVDTMGQLLEQSVLQKGTTGDRLETVLTAAATRKPDERVINGLINSMAFDTSVNVRLNALNGLYLHADQDVVRAGVLACLPREPNPVVQVAMIDFLVATRDREAAPELRRLISDDQANADVRESARRAMDQL